MHRHLNKIFVGVGQTIKKQIRRRKRKAKVINDDIEKLRTDIAITGKEINNIVTKVAKLITA